MSEIAEGIRHQLRSIPFTSGRNSRCESSASQNVVKFKRPCNPHTRNHDGRSMEFDREIAFAFPIVILLILMKAEDLSFVYREINISFICESRN